MDIQAFTRAARHWTPISVSGVARSGTRMISDILNQHPEIEIESEMHAKTLEAYFEFLDRTQANFDHYSERKGFVLDKLGVTLNAPCITYFWPPRANSRPNAPLPKRSATME